MPEFGLDLDPAVTFPITIREGNSIDFTITFSEAITGTWEIIFSTDQAGKDEVMKLIEGAGFSKTSTVITVAVGYQDNKLKDGILWFRIRQTLGTRRYVFFTGQTSIKP
jgi:hypothetical protein